METEQQRMTFRRYFIMVVLKMFLNPTSQQTISPWHLPPVLDVSNPRRFHWPYHILKWLRDAIRKFQDENRETCGGVHVRVAGFVLSPIKAWSVACMSSTRALDCGMNH
ncbi:hypothetical protein Ahy_B01g051867 [Arachis hypogaea]|uniref:Uncharacterized protein n=1 Tax=Arachis hypogaea TaxID=3818 RepID=A0A445AN30_ARAHY|nr:hypothetical protein Ahy_B01g051867 [Arachis hypogaea]